MTHKRRVPAGCRGNMGTNTGRYPNSNRCPSGSLSGVYRFYKCSLERVGRYDYDGCIKRNQLH